jgi:crotonobetainyl-CoA:carnitine CoA-transferase CaiB-like acyl-CoA transferase
MTAATGPLAGLKVLDLSQVAAGPLGTMILGDLGADVVKVERPGVGDDTRHMDVSYREGQSGYFLGLNKNKRSIVLDLKAPEDLATALALCGWADIVVQSFRNGVAAKLGLGYEAVRAVNPQIIYCSVSGFGSKGPMRNDSAYDLSAQALTGLMDITGEPDGNPAKCGAPIADVSTGLFSVIAILAALRDRDRTGQGQHVEVSLVGSALTLLAPYMASAALGTPFRRVGGAHNTLAPYQTFGGSDGEFFVVAVANDRLWQRLCIVVERPDLAADERYATNASRSKHRAELAADLQAFFGTRPAQEWVTLLKSADVPSCRVLTLADVLVEPHYRDNSYIVDVEHPTAGPIASVMTPIEFSRTPVSVRLPQPLLNEHEDEIRALIEGPR